jgi:putative membrane protein
MMRYGFGAGFGHMGFFGGFIMMFIGLLVIGLLIYGLVLLSRHSRSNQSGFTQTFPSTASASNALDILNQRYAKGEIEDDEYTRKKTALTRL